MRIFPATVKVYPFKYCATTAWRIAAKLFRALTALELSFKTKPLRERQQRKPKWHVREPVAAYDATPRRAGLLCAALGGTPKGNDCYFFTILNHAFLSTACNFIM
jgi:hypothetical protein